MSQPTLWKTHRGLCLFSLLIVFHSFVLGGNVGSIEPKWGGEVHQAIEILPVPIAERIGSLGIEEYHLLSSDFQLKLRVIICLGWVEVYKLSGFL